VVFPSIRVHCSPLHEIRTCEDLKGNEIKREKVQESTFDAERGELTLNIEENNGTVAQKSYQASIFRKEREEQKGVKNSMENDQGIEKY